MKIVQIILIVVRLLLIVIVISLSIKRVGFNLNRH